MDQSDKEQLFKKLRRLKACEGSLDFLSDWEGTAEELWFLLTSSKQEPRRDMKYCRPIHWGWWLVSELGLGRVPSVLAAWRAVNHAVSALEAVQLDTSALKGAVDRKDLNAAWVAAWAARSAAWTVRGDARSAAGDVARAAGDAVWLAGNAALDASGGVAWAASESIRNACADAAGDVTRVTGDTTWTFRTAEVAENVEIQLQCADLRELLPAVMRALGLKGETSPVVKIR